MTRLFYLPLAAALAVGCAAPDEIEEAPDADSLADGLAQNLGKADSADSGIRVSAHSVSLRGAAARTLYNLMTDANASAQTFNGLRIVTGPGTGCITNGERTFCQVFARTGDGAAGYEALVHGRTGRSAAGFLHNLLADSTGSGAAFVAVPWFACEASGGATWCGVERSEALELRFENVEDLGSAFVYEGWVVADGAATTTDRFQRADGGIFQRVPTSVADRNPLYVLTIEPRRGDASAPAETHLVAGELELGSAADLSTAHGAALSTDFAAAAGGFILATPSSSDTDDEGNGVWFVDPVAGAPSLALPALPAGWAYEGWVVTGDGPISTGRFIDAGAADSDGAGESAGPNGTPPFPGQDFVDPPLSLIGSTVVVSVEPEPDNGAGPFSLKPLALPDVDAVFAPTLQGLANISADNLARGQAIFGH